MHFLPNVLFSLLSLPTALGQASFSPFDPREATISSTHNALYTNTTTCRGIISSFLARIEALNPRINALVSLDPHVLELADFLDNQLQSNNGSAYKPLFCIPTLLKDNYNTASLPTTAGCLALADSRPSHDAPVVQALKDAGAVILGKTNMHELALEGISVSSLAGQTVNPYDGTRTPGGSSGGTGAAVAASFAVWGTGTDTVNSLRSPASANGLWSLRPTRGLISRVGVVPVSGTQDVLGPIARCVGDLAVALTVMARAGEFEGQEQDEACEKMPVGVEWVSYKEELERGFDLRGMRFGVVEGLFNRSEGPETDPVNETMENIISFLSDSGAEIVPITEEVYNTTHLLQLDTQKYEFRDLIDTYLSNPSLGGKHPTSLAELYSGDEFLVLPIQYPFINTALQSSTSNDSYPLLLQEIEEVKRRVSSTFYTKNLTAMIYPQQKNLVVPLGSPSQSGRNGILAALTGRPVVTVPVGYSKATETAARGVPVGMEILGREWGDGTLLGIAGRIEEGFEGAGRRVPEGFEGEFGGGNSGGGERGRVPLIVADRRNIPGEYPVGRVG